MTTHLARSVVNNITVKQKLFWNDLLSIILWFQKFWSATIAQSVRLCLKLRGTGFESRPGRIFVIEVVHVQCSKLFKYLDCAVLPMALCTLQNPWSHSIRVGQIAIPANTTRWTNIVSMLAHRLRRRPNIESTLVQRVVFAGMIVQKAT